MTARRIIQPVVDLQRRPDGPRDRQLLYGDTVKVAERISGWSRVTSDKDSYTGWVASEHLGSTLSETHCITVPATHAYERADMKSRDLTSLSYGSKVKMLSEQNGFLETELGFIPSVHCAPITEKAADPVAVAELFLGTPYLWGGNSRFGLDCSGLVQVGLLACGIACPGDSGEQERVLGASVPDETPAKRGDLLFWKGHVAWVSGSNMLLHANAHHMAVAFEPMGQAIARIQAQGDGPVTAHKRL
ncbi:NlpC/P60 family protein [uncultured Ruegeria sp.]|uniref:C40 family peptidase n=1 Tax=uncultured Ruegeria sp. TaxID=259304 RepID=UPI0026032EE2|nr:NlpC/P60 family protein [uncultured Ruegeria sp.]